MGRLAETQRNADLRLADMLTTEAKQTCAANWYTCCCYTSVHVPLYKCIVLYRRGPLHKRIANNIGSLLTDCSKWGRR